MLEFHRTLECQTSKMPMLKWLSKLRTRDLAPLAGAPAIRRQKTYSGESGYVYQYVYEGYRTAERDEGSGTQFVFDVSADRKTSFPVSVFLSDAALESWQKAHDQRLSSTERYAVAKMALFQAFDERENPAQMREEIHVRPADIEVILAKLGFS